MPSPADHSKPVSSRSAKSVEHWLGWGLLLVAVILGVWVRGPGGSDELLTLDSGYYLGVARDLQLGQPGFTSGLRAAPDGLHAPGVPPLLSVLAAWLGPKFVVGWLIPLLASLLALPVFFLVKLLTRNGVAAGLAAVLSVLSYYFLARSSAGWFDTDALQPVLATGLVAATVWFGRWRHWLPVLLFLLLTLIWLWWWDQASDVVFAFAGFTAFCGLPLLKPTRKQWMIIGGLGMTIALLGWSQVTHLFFRIWHVGRVTSDWPQVADSITELHGISWQIAGEWVAGHWSMLFLGLVGLLLLLRNRPRLLALPALGLVLLGVAALFLGQRFLIFLAPVWALGAGLIFSMSRFAPVFALVPIAILFFTWEQGELPVKGRLSPSAAQLDLQRVTETNALVWTWWDAGYAIQLNAQRATFADGGYHDSQISHCLAIPLVQSNPALAARWMRFFAVRGRRGIDSVIDQAGSVAEGMTWIRMGLAGQIPPRLSQEAAGRDWQDFFQPRLERPLYLLLEEQMANTLPAWFYMGTWDPSTRNGYDVGERYRPISELAYREGHFVGGSGGGDFRLALPPAASQRLAILKGSQVGLPDDRQVELNAPLGRGAIVPPPVANSMFHRLWVRGETDLPGFEFVSAGERFQIWRLVGE